MLAKLPEAFFSTATREEYCQLEIHAFEETFKLKQYELKSDLKVEV